MDYITLKNGKRVGYNYDIVPDGIIAYVQVKLTTEERKEFRYELKCERDVINILFK